MATATRMVVAGVFADREQALRAVDELQRAGFTRDEIGVITRDTETGQMRRQTADGEETMAGEGAAAGAAVGAGVGALVGLGVVSGVIPVIGPAIGAGALATILTNALGGAAVAGLAGALVGAGIPESDAKYYESELKAGKTLVTVRTDEHSAEALRILDANGARTQGVATSARRL